MGYWIVKYPYGPGNKSVGYVNRNPLHTGRYSATRFDGVEEASKVAASWRHARIVRVITAAELREERLRLRCLLENEVTAFIDLSTRVAGYFASGGEDGRDDPRIKDGHYFTSIVHDKNALLKKIDAALARRSK